LHIDSLGGPSDIIFETVSKLVYGFDRGGGAKFGLSHVGNFIFYEHVHHPSLIELDFDKF